jgi:hypothetical protein
MGVARISDHATCPGQGSAQLGVDKTEQQQGDATQHPRGPSRGAGEGCDQTRGEQPARTDDRAKPTNVMSNSENSLCNFP